MESSILLYIVNMLTYDTNGRGGVGLTALADWIGCSKPTAMKRLRGLCEYGVVREVKKSVPRGNGFRYEYKVTAKGVDALRNDGEVIARQFKVWQDNKMIALLEDIRKRGIRQSKTQKRNPKQLKLFGDE